MKLTRKTVRNASAASLLVVAIAAGCAVSATDAPGMAHGAPGTSAKRSGGPVRTEGSDLSGSQLWSQYCGLCHNSPLPKDYSDMQWEVVVMHMRVQARLTGEEERKIVQFLKASN